MIKRIEFSGINGIPDLRVDFTKTGFSWLCGAPSTGKTTLFDVLQILQRISRGPCDGAAGPRRVPADDRHINYDVIWRLEKSVKPFLFNARPKKDE